MSATLNLSIVSLPVLSERIEVYRDYGTVGLSLRAHPMSFLRNVLDAQGAVTAAALTSLFPKPGICPRDSDP